MQITYGKGAFRSKPDHADRYFLLIDDEYWFAFDNRHDRDQAAKVARRLSRTPFAGDFAGVVNHAPGGKRRIKANYVNVTFDGDTIPVTPANRRYEHLVKMLAEEAERRNWCAEWDEFAKRAGIPEELIKREDTVEVRLLITVPRKTDNHTLRGRAEVELMSMSNALVVQSIIDMKKVG